MSDTNSIYSTVTNQIIEQLEKGVAPWRKPWAAGHCLPRNVVSCRNYRGMNTWLLLVAAENNGWASNVFGTFRQYKQLGGFVKKGERGTKIVYWNVKKKKVICPKTGVEREEKTFFAQQYYVFALEQCGGSALDKFYPAKPTAGTFVDFTPAEKAIKATGADIILGGGSAFYSLEGDYIQVPEKESFEGAAEFYSTALHELVHWSGHESRLNRLHRLERFGDAAYAMEELVAEMGAAFLTATLGVPNTAILKNSANYLGQWLKVLRADSRAIFTAAGSSWTASDFLLSFSKGSGESEAMEESEAAELELV